MRAGAEFRFPGGESLRDQQDRVAAALEDPRARRAAGARGCHGGSIRVMLCLARPARTRGVSRVQGPERGGRPAMSRLPFAGVRRARRGDRRGVLRHPAHQGHDTPVHRPRAVSGCDHPARWRLPGAATAPELSFYLQHRSDDVGVYVIDNAGRSCARWPPASTCAAAPTRTGTSPGTAARTWRVAPDGTYYYRMALLGQGRTFESALPITKVRTSNAPHRVIECLPVPNRDAPALRSPISYSDYHQDARFHAQDLPDRCP